MNKLGTPIPERIIGEGFFLRQWKIADAAWYVAVRDEEIYRWTGEKRDLTVAETEEAIRKINAGLNSNALCFAIVDQLTQELLGNIALTFEEERPEIAEIMYWLAPLGRGRGIATMAVTIMCRWVFQSMGIDIITLKTLRGNIRSQRVAERAGFHLVTGELEKESNSEYLWFEKCDSL
jgi:[ribosomal protein S5]-alanine N-acetyltransferase